MSARLARLYIVTSQLGARIYARKSVNSASGTVLPPGFVFHGTPSDGWIRIIGGGWCTSLPVREIV